MPRLGTNRLCDGSPGNIYDACAIANAVLGFLFPVSKTGHDSDRDSQ